MTTPLEKSIKREVAIAGQLYTVTIEPDGIRIVEKGKRLGHAMKWSELLSGDAELSSQLRRSVEAGGAEADE